MAVPQIACHAVLGYLVLVVTYLDYVTSQTPPTCQDPFTNTHDVIFLLDVSMEIPNDTFSEYKSFVEELIEKHIPEVNDTKRFACISFNENNSDVIIDNLSGPKSGSNSTEVKDLGDKIRNGLMAASNSTQIGIIKATQTALDIVSAIQNSSGLQDVTSIYQGTSTPVTDSANQNATEAENGSTNQNMRKSVIIFYVTTGNFDDEVIRNVTLLLEEIETRVSGMLTVYGIGVGNFTKSDLETLVRAGNNTCRVKSLQEWWSYLSVRATSTGFALGSSTVKTSGEIGDRVPANDMVQSTLIVVFVLVNLVLLVLFLLVCIYAHKIGPQPKSPPAQPKIASNLSAFFVSVTNDESAVPREESVTDVGRANPSFRMSEQELPSSDGQATPRRPAIDRRQRLAISSLLPPAIQDQEILNESVGPTPDKSCAVSDVEAAEGAELQQQAASWEAGRWDERGKCEREFPEAATPETETFDPETVGADASRGETGQTERHPSAENVYGNQITIQLARAMVHEETPASTSTPETSEIERREETSDDERDYVNVPRPAARFRNDPPPAACHDYVNMSDFLGTGGDRSTGSEYVNVAAADRPPSYFDVFKADARNQIQKLQRLSRRLGHFRLSSDGPSAAESLGKDVLRAAVPVASPRLEQGNGNKPNYVNGSVMAATR